MAQPRPQGVRAPWPGFGRASARPEEVLLVCFYDPAGVSTVIETVAYLQSASRFSVSVLNLFEHRLDTGYLRLHPLLELERFDAVLIHNTVSYNPDNLRSLDASLAVKLRDFRGAKLLMKQDENYRFRELAQYVGDTGFDVVLTCLPPEAVPVVYPPEVVGPVRFERMLTGYVTPTLRSRDPLAGPRPVDIGYRGSIQPLSFGRLAYEKRRIGEDVAARLAGRRDLVLDISSRWEDRLGGAAWLDFLSSSKATLGAESGASIFDLAGDLDQRCADLEARHAHLAPRQRDEAVLRGLADLEGNVRYHQVSPRHFEAIACGAVQLLYPGEYSGLLQPGRHYLRLERDLANLDECVDFIRDEPRRRELAQRAFEEVVLDPCNGIESFVGRLDELLDEALRARGRLRPTVLVALPARHVALLGAAELPPATASPAAEPVRLHRVVLGDAGDAMAQPQLREDAGELVLPRRAWAPAGADSALHSWLASPAGLAGLQELLLAQRLLALDDAGLGAALGLPPGLPGTQAARARLQSMLDHGAAVAAASGLRGLQAVAATAIEQLPAALLLKAQAGAPLLAAAATDLLPAGALEGERAWWTAAWQRMAPCVDGALEDGSPLATAGGPVPLTWAALPAGAYYAAPPPPVPPPPALARWWIGHRYQPLRKLWRLLPAWLRQQIATALMRTRGHPR
ncbi:glycosyltransferase [Ramlibacter sp. AN1133]|uniref:glycosyltransferase n=1 Tax=Ramlibacter sp. AN1133 TaxID=3133429 RepID=UPI0030C21927